MRNGIIASLAVAMVALASVPAHALDKVILQMDWIPSGEETQPYIAVKEGFFAAEGLEVTIRPGRGSTDTVTKLATNTAEFGEGALGALMGAIAESGAPVKAIAPIYHKQADAIFTIKGNGITTIKDLQGKNISTAPFSSSNVIWPVFAKANGLDLDKITLLKADPNTLFGLLATGRNDATIAWVTNKASAQRALQQVGKELFIIPWTDYGLSGYGLSVFASTKVIKEQPQLVARFLRAYTKAIDFGIANPQKGAEDNHAMVNDLTIDDILAEHGNAVPLMRNEISQKYGNWTFDPGEVKKTWEWVAKAQNYPIDKIDPEIAVDRSFVPKS